MTRSAEYAALPAGDPTWGLRRCNLLFCAAFAYAYHWSLALSPVASYPPLSTDGLPE